METQSQNITQFPASFPETFKNFFALMSEDEDHDEYLPNLLEDKVRILYDSN